MSVMGRVITGFSKPYVAKYALSGSSIVYSSGQLLARGVSVSLDIESSDDNNFYADNQLAESASGAFSSGSFTLTVDGTLKEARRLIFGLPAADTSTGLVMYGDSMDVPNVGIGYIVRYMSEGVTHYVPQIIPKAKFNLPAKEAATQEDEIDWQTEELGGVIMRDDSANKNWFIDSDTTYSTEAAAEAILTTYFNI